MSLQQSPTSAVEHSGARNEPKTRLHGRGLFIARAGWVALTLLVLTLNAIAIPQANALLQAVCQPGALCINGWTPAEVNQLQQAGLSDLSQLSEQFVAVVQETMQPVHVSLWLRPPAHHGNHQALWRAAPSVPSEDEARDER